MFFNSKEDFYDYNEYLKALPINEDSVFKIRNFLRFSPNKFARKIGINEEEFQKEFNQLKKLLHSKLFLYKKIISLRDYRPDLGIFEKFINLGTRGESNWTKVKIRKSMCICLKTFKRHSNPAFYETIYYSYCFYDDRYFIFDSRDRSIELNSDEFNQYFTDYRDWVIDKILS